MDFKISLFKYGRGSVWVVEIWWSTGTEATQAKSDHQVRAIRDSHELLCCCKHRDKDRRLNGSGKHRGGTLAPGEVNRARLQPGPCPIQGVRVKSWVSFPPLPLPATPWPPCQAVACMQACPLPFPSPPLPALLKAALFQHLWKNQACSLQRPTQLLFSHQ